jgi:anaerobic magnesium-protoporphyrin IX monomethyl ester cyclase
VRGEGEITFRELLRALETQRGYDHIAGLSHRSADGFRHNPARGVSGLEDGEIRPPRRDVRVLDGYTLLGRQVDVIEARISSASAFSEGMIATAALVAWLRFGP